MKDLFKEWPHHWYGFERPADLEPDELPVFEELIDPHWRIDDIDRVVEYLRNSPMVMPLHTTGGSTGAVCTMCGKRTGDALFYQSDGVWLWGSWLVHWVEDHSVRLPNVLVAHIRQRGYVPPQSIDVPLEELPWPPNPQVGEADVEEDELRKGTVRILTDVDRLKAATVIRSVLNVPLGEVKSYLENIPGVVFEGPIEKAKELSRQLTNANIAHELES